MRINESGAQADFGNSQILQLNRSEARKEPKVQDSVVINLRTNEDLKEEYSEKNEQEVISAIEKANKHIRMYDRRLEFSIHDTTKQIMVKVIDTESDQVIREIPSEKILDMVAHLWQVAGILVDEKR